MVASTDIAAADAVIPYAAAPPGLALINGDRQYQPQPGSMTMRDLRHALNPLQHLPGVGMIYRAATGDEIPPPMTILGSVAVGAATGGPLGVFASVFLGLTQTLLHLGPAVPGHTLLATDNPATSDGPVAAHSASGPGITYADGSTGSPTWTAGQLTNFDLTQTQAGSDTGSETANHDLALAAYNRVVQAFGGLGNAAS